MQDADRQTKCLQFAHFARKSGMDISPDAIKAWLKKTGNTRNWLADQCLVSKQTVDGWLSAGRPIPGSSRRIVDRLMNGSPQVNPSLTLEQYAKAQKIAESQGKSLTQWIEDLIKNSLLL
jgi:hypothetical protein